ncbi:MAG: PEP-CTERM sorting domain-containing protein [Acetobacteraceae bacterium]
MRKFLLSSVAAAAALAFVGITPALATVDNTSLASPPGTYFGTGNPNTNWTVNTVSGVEMGLQASLPTIGPIVPVGNVYGVATGVNWNFNFSVNTAASGLTLSDVGPISLSLTDFGTGTTGSFDPTLIPDNATVDDTGFQNSEGLRFASIAAVLGDPDYDVNANDTYLFTLSTSAGSVTERVVVGSGAVPEPASLAVLGVGLLGLAFTRKRRNGGMGATTA